MSAVQTLPLLLNAAMVAMNPGDIQEEADSTPYIAVKNSFLTLFDESGERCPRRSASEPPKRRQQNELASDARKVIFVKESLKAALFEKQVEVDDASTEDDTDVESDSDLTVTSSEDSPTKAALCLADLVPETTPSQKPSLKSSAEAWSPVSSPESRPRAAVPVAEVLPLHVEQQFKEIMAVGQAAMRCTLRTTDKSTDTLDGWTVEGSCQATTWQHYMYAMQTAKESMRVAAARSRGVYIVGSKRAAFTPTPCGCGFKVRLAYVEDEQNACWDYLSKGFCGRYGCSSYNCCRWRHPVHQVDLEVFCKQQTVAASQSSP